MKTKIRRYSRQAMAVVLSVIMVLTCLVVGQITTVANATTTDTVNEASDTTMLVAAMTNSNDKYYTNKYVHMWNKTWNSGEQEVISDYPAMTSANYNGVAYFKPDESKISTKSGNYIKYALCTAASWTNAWECQNKTGQASFTKGTQYMMYRTSSDTDATFETFTPITITSITYPDSITEGETASVSVSVTGGFPWFYRTKLNDTSESKKYNVTVTNSAGTKVVNNQDLNYSDGTYTFNWTPISTSDTLTFTVEDNDSIDSVSYTKDNFSIASAEATHSVAFSASPDAGGSISPSGTQNVGEVTKTDVTATANTGYTFSSWTTSGVTKSNEATSGDDASMQVVSTADGSVTANFVKKSYTITYPSDAAYTVTGVSGSETVQYEADGTKFKIASTNASRYRINEVYYTIGSDATHHTLTADGNGDYQVTSMPASNVTVGVDVKNLYSIAFDTNDSDLGTVSAEVDSSPISNPTNVDAGANVTFTAVEESGGKFKGWYANSSGTGVALSTSASYTVSSVSADVTVYGVFETAATVTANRSYKRNDGTDRKVSGNGTVQVTGGTANADTSSAKVALGSVTFTAVPDSGCTFGGWYSDENCTTLVSTDAEYTTTVSADTTLYAAFNKAGYYLVGKFYLADCAQEITPSYNSTTYAFTQSSSNPAVYTYENDFMFAYDSSLSQYHLQYVSVGYGGSHAYTTAEENAPSGTPASDKSNQSNCWKWTCGDSENGEYPPTKLNNCYKHVEFTWNAITETLSWVVTDIDMTQYTSMYIYCGDYVNDHIWLNGGSVLTSDSKIYIPGTPYIVDDKTYNLILVKNTTIGDKELKYQLYKSDDSHTADLGGVYAGNTYKIDTSSDDLNAQSYTPPVIVTHTVTVNTSETGGSAAESDKDTAHPGDTVTITTAQSEGYAAVVTAVHDGKSAYVSKTDATTYTFTMPAGDTTVNVEYVANVNHTISKRVNDSELGGLTVQVSGVEVTAAAPSAVVKVTVNELPKGTYTTGSVRVSYKVGGTTHYVPTSGTGKNVTFLMPAQNVTVYAAFEEYEELAEYWYDGFDSSNDAVAAYTTKQLTEAKYNGCEYAYYKVSGRSDHVFAIKTPSDAEAGTGSSGYFYFKYPLNQGDFNGATSAHITYYNSSDEVIGDAKRNMQHIKDANSYKMFRSKETVPSGASYARVYHNNTNAGGGDRYADVTSAMLNAGGAYCTTSLSGYVYTTNTWNPSSENPSVSELTSALSSYPKYDGSGGDSGSGDYYTWNKSSAYCSQGYGSDVTLSSHAVSSKPTYANAGILTSEDYYIIVLYPEKNYGKLWDDVADGQEANLSSVSTIKIIASKYLPGSRPVSVDVTAKDGAIRNHDGYGPYITMAQHGDTAISGTVTRGSTTASITVTDHPYTSTSGNGSASAAADQDYQTATVQEGDIITVTTTIPAAYRNDYYVKGFVVNGVTPETYKWSSSGEYTLTYTVTGKERNHKLEITPVYFLKDDSNTVNFSIEGFTDDLQFAADGTAKWGDTMYVYPFYKGVNGKNNAFGSYPGQPLIFDGGKYYIQVPLSVDGKAVRGVTMSNGYWDHVHRGIMNWADNTNSLHRQTYDYDDFQKISNEVTPDNIIFEFKYRTTKENRADKTSYTTVSALTTAFGGASGNGFNDLEDHYGRPIDVFGNVLSSDDQDKAPVYVVSKGYQNTNAGEYATKWDVYYPNSGTSTTNVTLAGSLNPSALVLTEAGHFDGYDSTTFSSYRSVYNTLNSSDTARNHPVKITFESEILDGNDRAERSDGQWYHTNNNDVISASTRVEIQQADGSYEVDPFVSGQNYTTTTGCKAYFTNEEKNKAGNSYYGMTTTGDVYSNNKKEFTFEAVANGDYEFVEWKRLYKDEYYSISGNSSPMTSNDVYVARFRKVKTGTLTVNHTLKPITGYTGSGTTYVKLDILSGAGGSVEYTTDWQKNTAKLTGTYLKYNSSKYVRINLKTVPDGEDTFHQMTCDDAVTALNTAKSTSDFFPADAPTVTSGTATKSFEFQINSRLFDNSDEQVANSLSYYSDLTKMVYKYEIKYCFDGREFSDADHHQWYVSKGEFTADEMKSIKDGDTYKIPVEILLEKKPYEKDFMRELNWDFSTAAATAATVTGSSPKTISLTVNEAATTENTTRTAIFKLPYCYKPDEGYDYKFYDWVPLPIEDLRVNSQGGKYVVTTGYYFDHDTTGAEGHIHYTLGNDGSPILDGEGNAQYTMAQWESAVHTVDGVKMPDYDTSGNVPTFTLETQYGKRFILDDNKDTADKASRYIEAAESVYDVTNSCVKYFSYWKMTSQKTGKEIAKCYYRKFNFSAYEDYIVEPIYNASSASEHNTAAESEALGSTITYLDSSRNQWNDDGKGTAPYYAGDVLFKDFAIAYKYNSLELNTYTDKDVRVGMAVEMLGDLDDEAGSGKKITKTSHYEDKYSSTNAASKTELEYRLKNGTKSDSTKKLNIQKIASNVDGDSGYGALSNTSLIDNKNRLKYHYAVYNTYQSNSESSNISVAYRTAAYRAYSYIMVKENGADWDTASVAISEEPVYFVFEDIASK